MTYGEEYIGKDHSKYVNKMNKEKPLMKRNRMIITLCGSARFEQQWHTWNEVLTLSGHIVLGLAVYPSYKNRQKSWYTDSEKIFLDDVHKDKIKISDAILVLNRFAYIGESTLSEIEYARKLNKKLFALESWGKGCGIDWKHKIEYQNLAKKHGTFGFYSPIDTMAPEFKYPYGLLPEAGPYRAHLVKRIDQDKELTEI